MSNDAKVDGKGERKNTGKLPMNLVPVSTNTSIAKVLDFGAKKYAVHNWRRSMSWVSVIDCIERHLAKFKAGEDVDDESGLRHIEHILANVAFLNEFHFTAQNMDDRYKNEPEHIKEMFNNKHNNNKE